MNSEHQHQQPQNNSINSDTGSRLDERSKQKIESLVNAFQSYGKDLTASLTKNDICNFLDSKTKDPHGFNRKLLNKLFEQMEMPPNQTITVQQFIQDYVQYDTNIQSNAASLLNQIQTEKNNYNTIKQRYNNYRATRLNNEGIADNATITVTITDVNLQKQLDDIKLIIINIQYNDTERNTQFITGEDQRNRKHLQEQFVFTPRSKKDKFIYVLKGRNASDEEFLIGKKHIDLGTVDKNDKYEIEVEIPEIDDINTIIAYVKTEINFYWNDNAIYDEQLLTSEKKVNKLTKGYEQFETYLNQLNEPYINNNNNNEQQQQELPFIEEQMFNKDNTNYETNANANANAVGNQYNYNYQHGNNERYTQPRNESINMNSDNLMIHNNKTAAPHPLINKAEYIIKNTFHANNFSWNVYNKILASLLFICGMLNSFYRPDFPNALCAMLILICSLFIIRTFKNDNTRIHKLLRNLLYSVLSLIIYDLIWLILHGGNCIRGNDYYTGGKENGIARCALALTIINEVIKICLAFGLWAQQNKTPLNE